MQYDLLECFGKNFLSFLDFTRIYERKSGIFVSWSSLQAKTLTLLTMFEKINLICLAEFSQLQNIHVSDSQEQFDHGLYFLN